MPAFYDSRFVILTVCAAMACQPTNETGFEFAVCEDTEERVEPTPLRRLSPPELRNALTALLGPELTGEPTLSYASPVDGFDNDHRALMVNEYIVEQLHTVATDISIRVAEHPDLLLPCAPDTADPSTCLADLIRTLAPSAYRRPLSEEELTRWHTLGETLLIEEDLTVSAALVVQALIQTPEFLYHMESAPGPGSLADSEQIDAYSIANRLSFLVWQAPPDALLLADAAADQLQDPNVRIEHLDRLLADPRSEAVLHDFARQWLRLGRLSDATKSSDLFPQFNEALAADMGEETQRFVAATLLEDSGSFASLLTRQTSWATPELAAIYGVSHPTGTGWAEITLPSEERSGLLTQASLLSIGGHQVDGSPILRGVDVLNHLLCYEPPPPPGDVDTSQPQSSEEGRRETNRERFEARVADPVCQGCHQVINPTGYALESFDAIGQYRQYDNGFPVNTQGSLNISSTADGDFNNAIDLGAQLAGSDALDRCVVRKLNRFGSGRVLETSELCAMEDLHHTLSEQGATYREYLAEWVKRPQFIHRPAVELP